MNETVTDEGQSIGLTGRPKRLFVQMTFAAAILVAVVGGGFIYLLVRHAAEVRDALVWLLEAGIVLFIFAVGLCLTAIVWLILTERGASPPVRRCMSGFLNLMLPLAVSAGRLLGRSRDDVQASFIAINNALTCRSAVDIEAPEMLLLLPRCMQLADCVHKVSQDVSLCRRCGRCPMAEILNATDGMDLPIYVSTGGTQARRIVSERRPKVIVAVACERELTEGIRDVGGIPVVGVVNRRPHGPCYNTDVEVEKLIAAVKGILPEG